MKDRNVGLGITLIVIGLVWLLNSMGFITLDIISSIIELWPLILVVVGVNILFKGNSIVRAITWTTFFAVMIAYGTFVNPVQQHKNLVQKQSYIIQKLEGIQNGKLNINTGAAELYLKSGTANLMDISSNLPGTYHTEDFINGREADITVGSKESKSSVWTLDRINNRRMDLNINENVAWDVDVNFGAGAGKLDFSRVKLGKADLDAGAGSLDMYVGNNSNQTDIRLNAGASAVKIYVPRTSGVKVSMNNALTGTNINERDYIREGKIYTSKNYNEAAEKVNIEVHMGMGSFDIYRI